MVKQQRASTKMIRVTEATIKLLKEAKQDPRESYDMLLTRILKKKELI